MLDYLFTRKNTNPELLRNCLLTVRPDLTVNQFRSWQGSWGTLLIGGDFYPGFAPVEVENIIFIALGGPIPREDLQNQKPPMPDEYSRWILSRWHTASINWLEDLLGGFQVVCVNKVDGKVDVVLDAGGFVPCYATDAFVAGKADIASVLGSHADAVAASAGVSGDVDSVSVVDFLMHQSVTFPFTFYTHVRQMSPSAKIRFKPMETISLHEYWDASEESSYDCFDACKHELRQVFLDNVKRLERITGKISVLMSGGEDSRIVLSALPSHMRREAFTASDTYNHEARVAKRASGKIGAYWRLLKRSPTYYLDNATKAIKLSESHNFFYHGHFVGFKDVVDDSPVVGGLMADGFCKGSPIKSRKKIGVATTIYPTRWQYLGTMKLFMPSEELFEEVQKRRKKRNHDLKRLRPVSWAEWHSLHPASMNTNTSCYFINRRLFFSFEPFADGRILKWSARTPQSWKINRLIFHRAMRPILRKTWYIPHAKGTIPFFGWPVNGPLTALHYYIERARSKYCRLLGVPKKNRGPWPNWGEVVCSEAFQKLAAMDGACEREHMKKLLGVEAFDEVVAAIKHHDPVQALTGLHVLLWLRQIVLNQKNG